MFDHRSKDSIALQREFKSEYSFAEEINIWTDVPTILSCKEFKIHHENNSVIYHLKKQNAIMHVVSFCMSKGKIAGSNKKRWKSYTNFTFFQDQPPFDEFKASKFD